MADNDALLDNVLGEYTEDYEGVSRVIRVLRATWPDVDWIETLRSRAHIFPRFVEIGLSIDWWVDTVDQMSR